MKMGTFPSPLHQAKPDGASPHRAVLARIFIPQGAAIGGICSLPQAGEGSGCLFFTEGGVGLTAGPMEPEVVGLQGAERGAGEGLDGGRYVRDGEAHLIGGAVAEVLADAG